MKYFLVLGWLGTFIGCNDNSRSIDAEANNSSRSPATISTDVQTKPADDVSGCYMKITGRDTAILMLEQKANDLAGAMLYDNFEKDGSHGTVKGKKEGDILKLFYDFNAEGTRSVMEVYFKQAPGGLLRGAGDMDVIVDTAYFRSGINYSDKEAFSKVDCNTVKAKF